MQDTAMWSTVTPSVGSPVPCTRSKLAVCVHQNYIYLLGGRTRNQQIKDFWRYNISEHSWTELKSTGDGPARLEDHTMVAWKGNLYVFGGEVSLASTGETPLWVYNTKSNSWRKKWKYYSIVQPQGCRGHTAVIFKGAMHIYGGYRDLKGSCSELWSFSFEKEMWQPTIMRNSSELPPGRHDHSAVVHDSAMWVYGGMTNLHERTDFWRWDFETKRWARIKCKGGPGELHGHTACKVFSSMLLFGGERARQPQDSLWRFHFGFSIRGLSNSPVRGFGRSSMMKPATETWERLGMTGVLPGPRSRHTALVVPSVLLIPPEIKSNDRPKSIPCQSMLARSSAVRHRPVSSPPIAIDSYDAENENDYQLGRDWSTSYRKNLGDNHNQLNFRTIKERISNVSLLKLSYSTYSALSNSSDSVQEDESDDVAEMQNNTNEKLRSMSRSACLLPNLQPVIRYRNQMSGETISRDLMSVPNFQQLTNIVVPQREVQTPQAGPRTNCYSLHGGCEDSWTGSSREKLSFDRFLQYYSLVPGNDCATGLERSITDSEDSGIHGITNTESVGKKGYWNKGLTGDDAQLILLPGMVEDTTHRETNSLENSTPARRCVSAYEEISLIDLHNDNLETHLSDLRTELEVAPTSSAAVSNGPARSNCATSTSFHTNEFHKNFASCLNHSVNSENNKKGRPSVGGLELKTFPQMQEENVTNNGKTSEPANGQSKEKELLQNGSDVKRVQLCNTTYLSSVKIEENEGGRVVDPVDEQPHHFSMLIFGGREEGQQNCLSKPLTIWRCEVWR